MRKLFSASLFLTSVSFSAMALRFARAKIIAVLLGPVGTGVVSQFTLFIELLRFWGDLGLRSPVIKHVAEVKHERPDGEGYRQVITTSFVMIGVASLITTVAAILFSEKIAMSLFQDASFAVYLAAVACIVPVASVSSLMVGILKGNLQYKSYTRWTITGYFVAILLTPVVIYFFRLWGAVLVYLFFFGLPLLGYLVSNARDRVLAFSRRVSGSVMKSQLILGLSTVYGGSIHNLGRLLIASWIIKDLGLDQMGIYQVAFTFSSLYLTIPMQAVASYTMPVLAATEDTKETVQTINDNMRILFFLMTPVLIGLILFPGIVIRIFYSSEFLSAIPIMRIQLAACFFMMINASLSTILMARGRAKLLLFMSSLNWFSFVLLAYFLFPLWGLVGVAAAFVISRIGITLALLIIQRRWFEFRFYRKNQKLLMFSALWIILAMGAGCGASALWVHVLSFLFVLPWFFICSSSHERRTVYEKVGQKLKNPAKET